MISLRYHAISIAAVFLALAVGVVLGSSSVSQALLSEVTGEQKSLRHQVRDLRAERNELNGQLAGARRFTSMIGPMAVQDKLTDHSVVVVSTADVGDRQRKSMTRMLERAGASVTGTVRLSERFSAPGRAGELRQLVTRLLPAGVQLPVASDPGRLAGGLIGPLTLLDPKTGKPRTSKQERAAAFEGLGQGGFVRVSQNLRPAELAVVLTGGRGEGADGDVAASEARLAAEMDRSGAGAVLAGARGSAHGNGAVGVARSNPSISGVLSTVDNVDTPAGRVATVLALREQLEDKTGHYGLAGTADGPAPRTRS